MSRAGDCVYELLSMFACSRYIALCCAVGPKVLSAAPGPAVGYMEHADAGVV